MKYKSAQRRPTPPPIRLIADSGFVPGELRSDNARLFVDCEKLMLTDLGWSRRKSIGFEHRDDGDLVFDAERRTVYFAHGSLQAVELGANEHRVVAEAPFAQLEDPHLGRDDRTYLRQAVADEGGEAARMRFHGFLGHSRRRDRLLALAGWRQRAFQLVHLTPAGEVRSRIWMRGWSTGVSVDFERERICVASLSRGPRLLDFDGRVVAMFERSAKQPDFLTASAIRPGGGEIALGGHRGLIVWWPAKNAWRMVDPEGTCAAWSPDARRLWYKRGNRELWVVDAAALDEPRRVVAFEGNHAGVRLNRIYAGPPVPSPCGRYVLACLTHAVPETGLSPVDEGGKVFIDADWKYRIDHVVCVVDTQAGIVHCAPGRFFRSAAWLA